ncbi:MAG: hypothetical protein OXT67_13360 [Zetaproteobacteria bacterium]|nr:hypothetical protein [Zetaproteobacteria bacterium]
MRLLLLGIMVHTWWACGEIQPKYVPYSKSTGSTTDNSTDGDNQGSSGSLCSSASALTAYTDNVKSAVDSSCSNSSCHGAATTIGGTNLTAEDDNTNRSTLLNYTGTTGTTLFEKISSPTHGGGDQSSNLSESAINTWVSAETNCES